MAIQCAGFNYVWNVTVMAQVDGATSALKTGSNSERLKGVLFEFNLLFRTIIACLKNNSVKCVKISLS